MESESRIVEIGGVKLEVDLRHARTVEHYRIGDNVKVLKKEWSDNWKSYPGVIVGFDNFVHRPTVVVAYLDGDDVKFLCLHAKSEDVEICPMVDDWLLIDKQGVLEKLDRKIAQEENQLRETREKREYFLQNFGRYFDKEQ